MTIDISATPVLHHTPNPATMTCDVTLTGALSDRLAMEISWSKDGVVLPGVPHHHTPNEAPTHSADTTTVHFESALTMSALKPSDNGTYTCSAFVVSRTKKQPLSNPVVASMDMHVLGK